MEFFIHQVYKLSETRRLPSKIPRFLQDLHSVCFNITLAYLFSVQLLRSFAAKMGATVQKKRLADINEYRIHLETESYAKQFKE